MYTEGNDGLLDNLFIEGVLKHEFPKGLPRATGEVTIAAVGKIAVSAVNSPLLAESLSRRQVEVLNMEAFSHPEALAQNQDWRLALVLSPFKEDVAGMCQSFAPTALRTGVIDTIYRSQQGAIGINTNAFAAGEAIRRFTNNQPPRRALIMGAGASSRSVAVGLSDVYPQTEIAIVGRSLEKAEKMVADVGVGRVIGSGYLAGFSADLVINATTVGQTDDRDKLAFETMFLLRDGVDYFDLNNRESELQRIARDSGCLVMTGMPMQRLTNDFRAAILQSSKG